LDGGRRDRSAVELTHQRCAEEGAVAMNATVKDVMTTRVVAVRLNATYKEMAARLHEYRVSAFPVLDDDNKVIGVVSEADLLTKEALEFSVPGVMAGILHGRERAKADAVTAAELMTKPAVTIGPREPVAKAAKLMYSCKVKRLPVVDDDGRLAGIVSRADLLSVFSRPDEAIRRDIIDDVIVGTVLTDPARFTVTVKDGVVTVEGKPENPSVGRDMIEEIRHVEGVVAVRDRLTYPPEPRTVARTDMDLDF
jgi:CBS domain-containing protein